MTENCGNESIMFPRNVKDTPSRIRSFVGMPRVTAPREKIRPFKARQRSEPLRNRLSSFGTYQIGALPGFCIAEKTSGGSRGRRIGQTNRGF